MEVNQFLVCIVFQVISDIIRLYSMDELQLQRRRRHHILDGVHIEFLRHLLTQQSPPRLFCLIIHFVLKSQPRLDAGLHRILGPFMDGQFMMNINILFVFVSVEFGEIFASDHADNLQEIQNILILDKKAGEFLNVEKLVLVLVEAAHRLGDIRHASGNINFLEKFLYRICKVLDFHGV